MHEISLCLIRTLTAWRSKDLLTLHELATLQARVGPTDAAEPCYATKLQSLDAAALARLSSLFDGERNKICSVHCFQTRGPVQVRLVSNSGDYAGRTQAPWFDCTRTLSMFEI